MTRMPDVLIKLFSPSLAKGMETGRKLANSHQKEPCQPPRPGLERGGSTRPGQDWEDKGIARDWK